MKKWVAILLVLILAVVCLTGCGKEETNGNIATAGGNAAGQTITSAVPTQEPKMDPTPFKTVGNIVTFGSYEQDNDLSNGPESIEWIVLDVQDGKALLLSKYGLDARPYNTEYAFVTWETCTLRTWLNDDFLNAAFSKTEQRAILLTDVDNLVTQGFVWTTLREALITSGNNTRDYLFLLSYAEANKYLGVQYWKNEGANQNQKSRVAPTDYAIKTGAYVSDRLETTDGKPAGWWWLRSPGDNLYYAASVDTDGSLDSRKVYFDYGVIRPAFWLNLESRIF